MLLWLGAASVVAGCEAFGRDELVLPTQEEARMAFASHPSVTDVNLSGNVVEVVVEQPLEHVQRGGSLWARFGPYAHLFSPAARSIFENFSGVAALRVITRLPNGTEIARATLRRDATNLSVWRRGEALLATALQQGTERPGQVERLVHWAEGIADYEYNPQYVTERR